MKSASPAITATPFCRIRRSVSNRVGMRTARDTAPQTCAWRRGPTQPRGGLQFDAGVVVVLDLGARNDRHVRRPCDLVLRRRREQRRRAIRSDRRRAPAVGWSRRCCGGNRRPHESHASRRRASDSALPRRRCCVAPGTGAEPGDRSGRRYACTCRSERDDSFVFHRPRTFNPSATTSSLSSRSSWVEYASPCSVQPRVGSPKSMRKPLCPNRWPSCASAPPVEMSRITIEVLRRRRESGRRRPRLRSAQTY